MSVPSRLPALAAVILCVLASFLIARPAAAEEQTVLVLPFEVNADPSLDYLRDGLPQLLADRLAEAGFRVVGHEAMLSLLAAHNVKFLDISSARDMALLANANFAIFGSFNQIGESISIDARLVEAFGLKPERTLFVTQKGVINVLPALDDLATKIKQELLRQETITDIEVRGTKVLDKDVVLLRIQTVKGEIYDPKKVNDDLKRIYDVGYFDDVQAGIEDAPGGKKLVFTVVEKPRIQAINITGNEEEDDDDILEVMATKSGAVLNLKVLADDLNKVRELYRKEGYYLAEIGYEVKPGENSQARLDITVKEGRKLYIKSIEIKGAEQLDQDDLKKQLALNERGWLSWVFGTGVLKEELLERDAAALEAYYANRGFLDAKVGQPEVEFQEDGIHITFNVEEGARYKVGTVAFAGDLFEDPQMLNERIVIDDIAAEGGFVDRSLLRQDVKVLTDFYNQFGYAYAEADVDLDINKEEHIANITYRLSKNERVFIRRVMVEGNAKTRDNVVLREMLVGDGDLFNGAKLARSSERLSRLDFFKSVEIETVPTGDPSQLDLKVKVAEKPTGNLSLGAGYSSIDRIFFGGTIEERNLFGRAWTLAFSGKFGSQSTLFELTFIDPRFNDTRLLVGGDAFVTKTIYDEYQRTSAGAKARFGYPLGEFTKIYWSYKLERYNIADVEDDAADVIKDYEGDHIASVIDVTLDRDSTNDRFLPTKGTSNTLSVDYAGGAIGGSDDYIRYVYSSHWFKKVWWDTVFHAHGQIGYLMNNFGSDETPPFERFYLGGINTVRGYPSRKVAPKDEDSGDRIGGDKEFFVNLEYIFPIYEEMKIMGLVFFDAGNAWPEGEMYFSGSSENEDDQSPVLGLYKSVGVGVRWNSPLGPLRVEYGWPLDKLPDSDQNGKLEFSVGTTF